ncbi:50S ribosomal protein L11 methyltransferase [Marinicella sp. S1101]|uniref:50S ribosomal protein L11 methyltransferase n=1 Tax=Marinicella marina TaxID=2996016 RepID=UPI002260A622|nr:50S ribosomal protein L11 methyltransferase [Marinicella marina]MCX7552888.1 50S ribosomal protein L11 methyltransferase [Marinicella marina]MDJ1139803.1 50S ribosomal protein L11 methyltransferase [Marinicella marina]
MAFYEITIQLNQAEVAAVDEQLQSNGAVGVTYVDAKDSPIYEPKPGEMPLWSQIKLIGLFDDEQQMQYASQQLQQAYPQLSQQHTQLKDQVWERLWMDHFKPMQFGQNSWVIPDGYEVVDPAAHNLILDPGLAFGTGTHSTTALCLAWLDAHDVRGKYLVDFGCGSGVLAVMALLQGAQQVICVDIDDQAIQATQQNAAKNGVLSGIKVVAPEKAGSIKNQDGILANILAEPLMAFCDDFHAMLNDGGFIVLSGILSEQKDMICAKYSSRFVDIKTEIDQDWVRVSATKTVET